MNSETINEGRKCQAAEGSSKQRKDDKKQQSQKQNKKSQIQATKPLSENKSKNTGGDNRPSKSVSDGNKSGRGDGTGRQGGNGSLVRSTTQPPRLALFDHLPRHRHVPKDTSIEGYPGVHPAILKLGELFLSEVIHDDDDRAQALLLAFCNVLEDYKTPAHTSLSWDLDKYVKLQVLLLVVNISHDCMVHC